MRGISISTLVAIATATSLRFANANDLKQFDLSRFYENSDLDLSVLERNRLDIDHWAPNEPIEYSLSEEGHLSLYRVGQATAENLNNYGNSSIQDNSLQSASMFSMSDASQPLPDYQNDNVDGAARADGKCGPSPLTPVEIESLVSRTADRYGVDIGLAKAIAWTESRFDQIRNSPKGARGPMQLIPATAKRFGVSDVCDPASNIEGGVRYIRSLIDQFGNPLLAVAAYNAGEQPIYDHGGIPPFAETVGYVAAIMNYQLGLSTPRRSGSAQSRAQDPFAQASADATSTIIGKTGIAKFVSGVMQF
ncbi:lytic transglycosylase domain-containing protein [Ensifer sp. YR511]|uniref:lytic transglycosylase domain-containing protein n=1 Tax=Ensifer sp. YR511 TaxID=1855294 RepID=UPI0008880484|nr:lytic transglycosylase domain-containing protein [Ensifer sp. YR511]SDN95833.1 Transglycosylase SLT domain-containing protein [Ensifer sp. YR511]